MSWSPRGQNARAPHQSGRFTGDGVLILDKPVGMTSHDVVQELKNKLGAAKAGHAGTLDPFATGVLVVFINGATKLSPFLASQEKTYRFTIAFGVATDTQDRTGTVVDDNLPCEPLQEREIREACAAFVGEIEQRVPRYSAVRVKGQRLYRLARQGVQVTPPTRKVKIKSFSLCEVRWPEVSFEVTCSKGTYVRSLAMDVAQYLHCNGHVGKLRRLRSGWFHLGQALSLEQLDGIVARGELDQVLIPPAQALEGYPAIRISHRAAGRMRRDGVLNSREVLDDHQGQARAEGPYKVVDPEGDLVAVVRKSGKALQDEEHREARFETLRVFQQSSRNRGCGYLPRDVLFPCVGDDDQA
ncbi:MAG: tRNA pseudouridine(55) synthase TruB [Syntrophobacteria bacterium]